MAFRPAVRSGGVFSPANRVVPGVKPAPRTQPVNPIAQRRTLQVQRMQQQLGLPRLTQPAPAPQPVAAPVVQTPVAQPALLPAPRPTPGDLSAPGPAPYIPPEVIPGQRPTPDQLNMLPPDQSLIGTGMPGAYIPPEVTPGQRPRPDQLNMGGQSMMPNMGGFDPAQLYNQYAGAMPNQFGTLGMSFAAEPQTPSVFDPTQPTVGT